MTLTILIRKRSCPRRQRLTYQPTLIRRGTRIRPQAPYLSLISLRRCRVLSPKPYYNTAYILLIMIFMMWIYRRLVRTIDNSTEVI